MHHHFPIQQRPEVNIFYDFRDFAQIMDFIDFRLFIPVTFFFRWRAVWLLSDFGTLPFTFKLFTLFTTETFWDGTKVSFYLSMTLNWLPRWHDKKCFVCGLIKFVIDKWDRSKLVTFPFRTPRGLVTEIKLQAYKSRYLSVTLENFVQPNLQVAFISIL